MEQNNAWARKEMNLNSEEMLGQKMVCVHFVRFMKHSFQMIGDLCLFCAISHNLTVYHSEKKKS